MADHDGPFLCGVDTGGTFTDCVAIDASGRVWAAKAPSTPPNFADGFFEGLRLLAGEIGLTPDGLLSRTSQLVHGTTVATNALVERRGARVGLIATRGHRDALFVMRGAGRVAGLTPEQAMRTHETGKPEPLVPKALALEATERVDWKGDVIVRLDEAAARETIRTLVDEGVESVALALLWAFRNPVHEQRLAALVQEIAPGLHVTEAHQIAPRTGEYERTAAAVIDAYVKPITTDYLQEIERRCRDHGYRAPLLVMQCDGNVAPVATLIKAPVLTLQSGPAAGLEACRLIGTAAGVGNVIAVDMGGTTCDIGLVVDRMPLRRTISVVSQYEYFTPSLEIESIGVGGGSIAWIDELSGALRVGPRSAGANPGPACYGRGGVEATITDADLILGRLDPDVFLGGRMRLDREAAKAALEHLGDRLGLTPAEVAAGISRLAELQIAEEIRKRTVAKGYDPREFVIFAYGGAGPVHLAAVARELGIATVIVPLRDLSSLWSAFGAAIADLGVTAELSTNLAEPVDLAALAAARNILEQRVTLSLQEAGADVSLAYAAGLRYRAQVNEVWVALEETLDTDDDVAALITRFESEYEALYGTGTGYREAGIEIAALRCVATRRRLPRDQAFSPPAPVAAVSARGKQHRSIYWEHAGAYLETPIVRADELGPDQPIDGAAIIELDDTTIVVHSDQRARLDAVGNVRIELSRQPKRAVERPHQAVTLGARAAR